MPVTRITAAMPQWQSGNSLHRLTPIEFFKKPMRILKMDLTMRTLPGMAFHPIRNIFRFMKHELDCIASVSQIYASRVLDRYCGIFNISHAYAINNESGKSVRYILIIAWQTANGWSKRTRRRRDQARARPQNRKEPPRHPALLTSQPFVRRLG
ncbi:MAG: hypothetical protein ACRYHA_08235 [Janthinobacterium lividum]